MDDAFAMRGVQSTRYLNGDAEGFFDRVAALCGGVLRGFPLRDAP